MMLNVVMMMVIIIRIRHAKSRAIFRNSSCRSKLKEARMCNTEDCPPEELSASQAATTQATRQEVMTTEDSEDETTETRSISQDFNEVTDVIRPTKGDANNLEDSDGNNEVQNDPTTEIADDVTTNIPVAESNQDNDVSGTTTTPGDTDEQEYEEHEPITIPEHTNHDEDHDVDAAAVTVGGRVQCYTCGSLFSSPTSDQSCDSFTPEAGQVAECGDGEVGDTLHCTTQAPGSS